MLLNPSMPILIKRGVSRGVLTVWREREWLTAFGALFGVFVLVQLLLLILMGMEGTQSLLRTRTDLRLEIRDEAADANINTLYNTIQKLPYVDEVVYVTREQAYEKVRTQDPELITFLEEFKLENPFPETIGVTLKTLDDYDVFVSFTEQDQWKTVLNAAFLSEVTNQEAHVYELISLTNAARTLTVTILLITAITLIFITTELIRRRALARADEMLVERLVGAHSLSILLPFWTEATLLFIVAILASSVVLFGLVALLPTLVPALSSEGILQALHAEVLPLLWTYLPWLLIGELIAAPILAGIGSWFGVRSQLQTRTLVSK